MKYMGILQISLFVFLVKGDDEEIYWEFHCLDQPIVIKPVRYIEEWGYKIDVNLWKDPKKPAYFKASIEVFNQPYNRLALYKSKDREGNKKELFNSEQINLGWLFEEMGYPFKTSR